MPPATWALLRQWLRHRLEAHEKLRTVGLGPSIRLRFDDALTLHQALQDELLADGTIRQARLDQMAETLAASDEGWHATLLIGPPGTAALAPLPPLLEAAVAQIHVQVGIERLRATAFARERALRFPLTPAMRDALDAGARVSLVCTHPRYFWRRRLPIPTLRELRRELGEHRAGGAHADGQAGTRRFQPTARSTAA